MVKRYTIGINAFGEPIKQEGVEGESVDYDEYENLEKELMVAIEIIEDSGVDYDEIVSARLEQS